MLRKTQESRELSLFCDFHAHSRKRNIFIYGCASKSPGERHRERIFPLYIYTIY